MDHNSLINRKTFEVCKYAEDCSDYFICDKEIASIVSLLNKKGYETYSSCSGHYKIEFFEWFDEDICNIQEYQNNPRIIIKEIRDNSFDYWSEVEHTGIYILFTKKIIFDFLPEGFTVDICNDRTCISCRIEFYDDFGVRKKREIVEDEISEKCNILMDWVVKLPYRER